MHREIQGLENRSLPTVTLTGSVAAGITLQDSVGVSETITASQIGTTLDITLSVGFFAAGSATGGITYLDPSGFVDIPQRCKRAVVQNATLATNNFSLTVNMDDGTDIFTISSGQATPLRLTGVFIDMGAGTDDARIGSNGLFLTPNTANLFITNTEAVNQVNTTSTSGQISTTGQVFLFSAGPIDLSNQFNTFTNRVTAFATGEDVTINAQSNLILGNIDAGNFSATLTDRNMTQSVGATVDVTGLTTLDTGLGNITLTNVTNDFTNISINANNATIIDTDDITFVGTGVTSSNVTADLTVTADDIQILGDVAVGADLSLDTSKGTGNIADSGTFAVGFGFLTVGGSSTLVTQATADIDLSLSHTFHGPAGTLTIPQTNNATITNITDLNIDFQSIAGDATVVVNGDLTDKGIIVVGGVTTITALDDVILNNNLNDLNSLNVTKADNVTVIDVDDLTITGINAAADLNVSATGNLNVIGDVSGATILLTAGEGLPTSTTDDLTIGKVRLQSGSGDITLNAADNLVVDTAALISAGLGLTKLIVNLDNKSNNDPEGGTTNLTGNYSLTRIEIIGGTDDDFISGTSLPSTTISVLGDDGNDTIIGTESADTLNGGMGADSIVAGPGADMVDGGDGDDVINTGNGSDVVDAGAGMDTINIFYEGGDLVIDGGTEDDSFNITDSKGAVPGSVTADGNDGNDLFNAVPLLGIGGKAKLTINGGAPAMIIPGDVLLLNLTDPTLGGVTQPMPNPNINGDGSFDISNPAYGDISFTSIEELLSNEDPNPIYDANDAAPGFVNDTIPDTFDFNVGGGIVDVIVDGVLVDRLPLVGLQSVGFNGSSDNDTLTVNQSAQAITLNLNFFANALGSTVGSDRLLLIGGTVTDSFFRPSGNDFKNGTVEFATSVVAMTGVEQVQFEGFAQSVVTPSASQNQYAFQSGSTLDVTATLVNSFDLVPSVAGSRVSFVNVASVTLDVGASDGAAPTDTVTIANDSLRSEVNLGELIIRTGPGSDLVEIQDGDFRLLGVGNGITIDGGVATDNLRIIATGDVEENSVGFTLAATSDTAAFIRSNAAAAVTTIALLGFSGEAAELTGNATSNNFDLGGWNRLGTAVINGQGGTDTLTGLDVAGSKNLWNITGANQGAVGGFQFVSIENLTGGTVASDEFLFSVNGQIDGQIFASGGTDTLNFGAYTSAVAFSLNSNDPTGYQGFSPAVSNGFAGIDSITGGANSSDSITGLNIDSTWDIDGTNNVRDNSFFRTLAFTNIELLNGGLGADTFVLTGVQANQIRSNAGNDTLRFQNTFSQLIGLFSAGTGTDTLDFRNFAIARSVALTGNSAEGYSGTEAAITQNFSGIDVIIGGSATTDTLTTLNVASQWVINGPNRGSYTDSSTVRTLTIGDVTDATGVRGFENFTAGSDFDTFSFINGGTLGGTLDGGGNFDSLIGDGSRPDEIFSIDATNEGTFRATAGTIIGGKFKNIETLVGGAGQDSFIFTNNGKLDGPIDGVGGNDSLIGDNDGNDFHVTQQDGGTLALKIFLSKSVGSMLPDFTNIETLSGGSGTDNFLLDAVVVGNLIGLAGNDTFTFNAGGAAFGSVFAGTGTDTIVGDDDGNLFNITGDSTSGVQLSAVGRGNLATKTTLFTEVENLTGGGGDDSFIFTTFGSITGLLNGKSDGSATGSSEGDLIVGDDDGNFFSINTPNAGSFLGKATSFSGIENLLGGQGDDTFAINANLGTLQADGVTWFGGNIRSFVGIDTVLVGPSATVGGDVLTEELSDTIDVRGRIVGLVDAGVDDDVFILQNGAILNSQVTGGNGNDSFSIEGVISLGNELRGGAGNDTYTFQSVGKLNQQVNGESGSDTIVGDADGNVFSVSTTNAGTLAEHGSTGNLNFINVENLTGGAFVDTYAINASLDGSITSLAGDDVITIAVDRTVGGSIITGDGADIVSLADGSLVLGSIQSGAGDDIVNVDFLASGGVLTRNLTFDGGDGTDVLRITGNDATGTTTYSVGPAASASSLTYSGGLLTQNTVLSNVESVDDRMTTANLIVNSSTGNETINVVDGITGFTEVNFNGAFRPYAFRFKTNLTVNGNAGNDVININNPNRATGLNVINANGDDQAGVFTGNDTFNLLVNFAGSLNGGNGTDNFVYTNGVVLTGSIDGGAGTDTVNAASYSTAISTTVTASTLSGFAGTTAALMSGTFSNVDSLRGGNGSDTLSNATFNADWELDGGNRLFEQSTSLAVAFSSYERVNGGSGIDIFTVSGTQALVVTGGAGTDTLVFNNNGVLTGSFDGGTGNDTLSFSGYTSARAVALTGNAADGFSGTNLSVTAGFSNVDTVLGGASTSDSITGQSVNSKWEIDGTNRYVDLSNGRALAFGNVENLLGSSGVDLFEITGTQSNNVNGGIGDDEVNFANGAVLTGTIDGGADSDEVDFSLYTSAVAANAGLYSNIEEILGGSTLLDSIVGATGIDTFSVTDANQGVVNGISFSSFENIDSGAGNDVVNFTGTGNLTGGVNGGTGTDSLNLSGLPGTLTVTLSGIGLVDGLTGSQLAIPGGFTNIDSLTGKGADTLVGTNNVATWTIGAGDSYATLSRTLAIGGFTTLTGGSNIDTYNVVANAPRTISGQAGNDVVNISDAVTLTGTPDGGPDDDTFALGTGSVINGGINGGAGSDTLSFANSNNALSLLIGVAGTADGYSGTTASVVNGYDNINAIVGSKSGSDVLTGRNVNSNWVLNTASSYTDPALGRTLGFGGFETLNGGNQVDNFTISNAQTASLNGNAGSDTFTFGADAGQLTGAIAGGTGINSLSFAGFVTTAANVTLTTNSGDGFSGTAGSLISGGFSSIKALTGGAGTADTLTGENVNASWLVDVTTTYTDNSTTRELGFSAYENLTGGTNADTFLINAALAGTISGGDGNDVVDVAALGTGSVGGGILTGNGTDEIFLHTAAGFTGALNSGADSDLIQIEFNGSVARTFTLDAGSGSDLLRLLGGEPGAASKSSASYSVGPTSSKGSISTTVDGVAQSISLDGFTATDSTERIESRLTVDTFQTLGSNSADTINVVDGQANYTRVNFNNAFAAIEIQNAARLAVLGQGNADTINLNNPNRGTKLTITNVDGGSGNDTINVLVNHAGDLAGGIGDDKFVIADKVTITGESANAINGGTLSVTGSDGVDTIDLSAYRTSLSTNLTVTTSGGFDGQIAAVILGGGSFTRVDSVAGSSQADFLIGLPANATWQIDGTNTYVEDSTNRSIAFSSFESFVGDASQDTFQISGAQSGTIDGNMGNDRFVFMTDDAVLTGSIEGNDGIDTLDFSRLSATTVSLTLSARGFVDGFDGSVDQIVNGMSGGFSNIDRAIGGTGGSDDLTGLDAAANWTIGASNSYVDVMTSKSLAFSGFETLLGGNDEDTFAVTGTQSVNITAGDGDDTVVLADNAVLTGKIDGGNPTVAPGDTLDISAFTTPTDFTLDNYTNFETLIANDKLDNTLLGSSGNDVFRISDPGEGTINGLAFVGFNHLDGLSGDDSFTYTTPSGFLSGSIEGGSGDDSVSFSGITNPVAVNVQSVGSTDGFNFTDGVLASGYININSISGGASVNDSLTGLNVDSSWAVGPSSAYLANNVTVGFSAFENLNGQAGNDSFLIIATNSLNIFSGGGADVVDFQTLASLTGNITLGSGNDQVILSDQAAIVGTVDGGPDLDLLDLTRTLLAQSVTLGMASVDGGFSGVLAAAMGGISGGFSSIDSLFGGAGDDVLTGLGLAANWTINSVSTYVADGETLTFTGINNAVGGGVVDQFQIAGSVTIDLFGGNGADQFNVQSNVALTGTLDGQGGNDTFNFSTVVLADGIQFVGGAGNDTLNFATGITPIALQLTNVATVETVIGTGSADTLVGTSSADDFVILGSDNNGTVGSIVFQSFENLSGGLGADRFAFNDGLGITGSIDGGADTDTLDYSAYTTVVTVNFVTGSATNVDGTVSSVENATGGSNNDVLTGSSQNNTLIGNDGSDVLTDGSGNDSLDGGQGDDTFVLTPGSSDVVTDVSGTDTLDFSLSVGPITIDLDATASQAVRGAHTLTLGSSIIETFIGSAANDVVTAGDIGVARIINGNGGSDTYRTSEDTLNNWAIDLADHGFLGNNEFSSVENLVGGTDDDRFVFSNGASLSGTINGGDEAVEDQVDYSAQAAAITINLAVLTDIEAIVGGASANDTIQGANSATSFEINAANAGTAGSTLIAFSGVENLAGGTNNDTFVFTSTGSLTGTSGVNGGTGSNTLTLSDLDDDIVLTATSTVGFSGFVTAVSTFSNITTLGGGTGDDTLTGTDGLATWGLDGTADYQSGGRTLNFSDIENLVGGSGSDTFAISGTQTFELNGNGGDDTFSLANGASLIGLADGGTGTTDRILFTGTTGESISLTGPSANGFNGNASSVPTFTNIDSMQGGTGSDTLQGVGGDATWTLNSSSGNSYQDVGGKLLFSSIDRVVGGAAIDQFQITGVHGTSLVGGGGDDVVTFLSNGSAISGTIDGGDGTNDRLDYSALTSAVSVNTSNLINVERVTGGQSVSDTLLGLGSGSTFLVTGLNSGSVDSIAFTNFENLSGGAGGDLFDFADGSSVSGIIGGSGTDVLDLSDVATARSVTLVSAATNGFTGNEAAAGSFTGIDDIRGSSTASDTLIGLNADSTWAVTSTDPKTVTAAGRTLSFSGFQSVVGNASVDTFNISGSAVLNVEGGAGNDRFVFASGATLTGTLSGGLGIDTLNLSAQAAGQTVTLAALGVTDGFRVTVALVTGTATNLEDIVGTSLMDVFNGLNAAGGTFTVGTTDSYTSSGRTLTSTGFETQIGGLSSDIFNIQGNLLAANTARSFVGNSGIDTFNVNFPAATNLATGTSLAVTGNSSSGGRDTVNITANGTNDGARTIGLNYTSSSSGNVAITGFGGTAFNAVTVESVNVIGDAVNNDKVTVTGTTAADEFTLTPAASSMTVLLNGAGKGVAGGSTGPDVLFSGVSATGFTLNGSGPTIVPGDTLRYNGTGTATITSPSSGSLTQSGAVGISYSSIEDLDPLNPIAFVINAQSGAGDSKADNFRATLSGALTVVTLNGLPLLSEEKADIASLTINGSNDDDSLTVDLTTGNPIPTGGISFVAGAQVSADSVAVIGTISTAAIFAPSGTTNGTSTVTIGTSKVSVTGVEPISFSTLSSLTLVTPNGADTLTVDAPVAGQNRITGTSGGVGFSAMSFTNTPAVTIDAATNGASGADSVTVSANLSATGLTSFAINTGAGADTVNGAAVTTLGLAINTGVGNDTITVGGGNDTITAGSGTDTLVQTASGTQTLTLNTLTGTGTDTFSGIEIASLTGGSGNDTINASAFTGSVSIVDLAGSNVLTGGSGNDTIQGGANLDTIVGNGGDDLLSGGSDRDSIVGGAGNDTLRGQGGNDTLTGNEGNDTFSATGGFDTVIESGAASFTITNTGLTGLGTDVFSDTSGTFISNAVLTLSNTVGGAIDASTFTNSTGVFLYGGTGNDTLTGSNANDVIYGLDGNDSMVGGLGNDSIYGSSGRDTLDGQAGDDRLFGQGGSGDLLIGGLGNDSLDGGIGEDQISESGDVNFTLTNSALTGLGTDILVGIESATLVGGNTANTINASGFSGTTVIAGGGGNDSITGGSGIDLISGNSGDDLLIGLAGNDSITGNAGNDSIDGGADSDTINMTFDGTITLTGTQLIGDGTDTYTNIEISFLTGGVGNNVINASAGSLRNFINGGDGNDTLSGGSGNDILNGGNGTDFVAQTGTNIVLSDAAFTATGTGTDQLLSIESVLLTAGATASLLDASGFTIGSVTLTGGLGNDTLLGGSRDDSIDGLEGNDSIIGGGGNDVVVGGLGIDTIRGGEGNDNLNGGSDDDQIFGDGGNDGIAGGAGNDSIEGGLGGDTINGDLGNDTIRGGEGDDFINGGRNNDTIFGDAGNDSLYGDLGEDAISGGIGNDFLLGDFGNDTLLGGLGNDFLYGSADNDTLIGGEGDDYLTGQGGTDKLAGNNGTDTLIGLANEIDEAFVEGLYPHLL